MNKLETNLIHTGDAFDVLPTLPENSVHAVVSDPPYGLAFMGRDWDDFEPREYQEWCMDWAREAMRVLRPGGHLLAFSGNRTHHRLFVGVEDAGFEVRDTVTWHYGSGFPKNTSTLLKPATEYVVVARKPLGMDTVESNIQEWGVGALNIDACRIGTDGENLSFGNREIGDGEKYNTQPNPDGGGEQHSDGRYPSNVVFHDDTAQELDAQNEHTKGGASPDGDSGLTGGTYGDGQDYTGGGRERTYDSGGPSRYFYTSKASKSERTQNGQIQNDHPTVKPLDLMEWLVKLVTREGQIVLDPFTGSGTTCKAAKNLGREFVGIEQQPEYADVARARVGLTPNDPSHIRGDDGQAGLESFE